MKKFNYFLVIAFFLIFSSTELRAFTNSNFISLNPVDVDFNIPFLTNDAETMYTLGEANFQYNELQLSTVESSSLIQNNLNLLYSLCVLLVVVNLAVQIKIVVQMVNLFFMFKKKDESIAINF